MSRPLLTLLTLTLIISGCASGSGGAPSSGSGTPALLPGGGDPPPQAQQITVSFLSGGHSGPDCFLLSFSLYCRGALSGIPVTETYYLFSSHILKFRISNEGLAVVASVSLLPYQYFNSNVTVSGEATYFFGPPSLGIPTGYEGIPTVNHNQGITVSPELTFPVAPYQAADGDQISAFPQIEFPDPSDLVTSSVLDCTLSQPQSQPQSETLTCPSFTAEVL